MASAPASGPRCAADDEEFSTMLHRSIDRDDADTVLSLLGERSAVVEDVFVLACCRGAHACADAVLSADPELLRRHPELVARVFRAVSVPPTLLQLFLACGCDPNATIHGESCLHIAAQRGESAACQVLLEHGARPDVCDLLSRTALFRACEAGKLAAAETLIRFGGDVRVPSEDGRTPLHVACALSDVALATVLIDAGAQVTVVDHERSTPLHQATKVASSPVVELLLRHGADVRATDRLGLTAFHWAVASGPVEIVKRLAEAGSDVNAPSLSTENSPLGMAVAGRRSDVWRFLLRFGVDLQCPTTALAMGCACDNGLLEAVIDLFEAGVPLDVPLRGSGQRPLQLAAFRGHAHIVRFLCSKGVNVHGLCKHGMSALHFAVAGRHVDCVEALIEGGCDPSEHAAMLRYAALTDARMVEPILRGASRSFPLAEVELLPEPLKSEVLITFGGDTLSWRRHVDRLELRFRLLSWRRALVVMSISRA
jgi:ankyrin repeat protein